MFDETESEDGDGVVLTYRGSELDGAGSSTSASFDKGSADNTSETMLGQTARRVGTAAGNNRKSAAVPSLLSKSAVSLDASSFLDAIDETTDANSPSPTKKNPLKIPKLPFGNMAPVYGQAAKSNAFDNTQGSEQPEQNSPPTSAPMGNSQPFAMSSIGINNNNNNTMAGTNGGVGSTSFNYSERSGSEDLKELLTTLSKKTTAAAKAEFRNNAKNQVLEQAYMRSLNSVENGAYKDDMTTLEAKQLMEDWKHQQAMIRAQKHDEAYAIKAFLDEQKRHNAEKAEEARADKLIGQPHNVLPETSGHGRTPAAEKSMQYDSEGRPISGRIVVSKILSEQIKKNAKDKVQNRQATLDSERDYLNRLAMEIELHNAMSRSSQLEKQRTMLEAWEKEGHIRNLKKLQPFGVQPVQAYIQRNLAADPYATSTGPLMYTSTLGNSAIPANMLAATASVPSIASKLNMSIGYDPRRPKVEW